MAISVTYVSTKTVVETLADTYVSSSDNTVTYTGMNSSGTFDSGTVAAPCTTHAAFRKTMSGGAGTIDLTAITGGGANGATASFTGLKVQFFKFRNLSTNANSITITFGASNPYNLMGSDFSFTLAPGQECEGYLKEQAPDVGSGAKNIDISGTSAQVLECQLIAG